MYVYVLEETLEKACVWVTAHDLPCIGRVHAIMVSVFAVLGKNPPVHLLQNISLGFTYLQVFT